MAITRVTPYLMFDGTAEKAIQLYQSALEARADGIMRFGDEGVPGPCADADKNRVMHALVHIGAGAVMLSDRSPGEKSSTGSNVYVTLDFDDVADMAKKFEALAVGGKVTMPLEDTFWGAKFGTLTDAFGLNWMFGCNKKSS